MKKWRAASAALILPALAVSGCSSAGGGGTTELSFLMSGDGGETDQAYKDVVAAFEEEHPEIDVNLEFFNTNDYDQLLKTRLSGGAGPDLYWFDLGNIQDFIEDGFAADLREGGDYLNKLTEDAAEDSVRYSPDGGAYNVPISLSGNGIIYNAALFEQAGISAEPQTYSELKDACQKLLDAGIIPFAMSAQDNWWPQFIIYYALAEAGANEALGERMTAGELTFTESEEWRRALDVVKELVPYYMPNPLGTTQTAAQSAFLSGEAAIFPATWILSDARETDLELDYMNFPTVDEEAPYLWGTYQSRFGINPGNDKVEEAQQFIDFFFQDDVYREWLSKVKLFPTTSTVEVGAEVDPLYPDMQASWEGKEFVDLFSPPSTQIQEELLVGMQNLISGERTTDQVLADLDLALEEYLATR